MNQTFQNFEVIVVDDCSTDSSCAIVESYIPKFGGRLTLSHMEENSGSGALPRNKGLPLSRGEYVFFMDADDMLTKTALEEMYTLAKNYNADVISCEKYYRLKEGELELRLTGIHKGTLVDKPTFESKDLAERIRKFCNNRPWSSSWVKVVKRNVLIENHIVFPKLSIAEDIIWTVEILCCAKKILRVPNLVYIYRESFDSVMIKKRTVEAQINVMLNPIIRGVKFLDKFLNRFDFFKQNVQYRYAVMDTFIQIQLSAILGFSAKIPVYEMDKIFRQEFAEDMGEQSALISYLCSTINLYRLQLIQTQQQFNQFAVQAQARIKELEAELNKKN